MTPRTVLVIGGTGHVGRKVIAVLRKRGVGVRALVRPGSDASRIEGPGVTIVRGDMMDPASLDAAFGGVEAAISCAAGYTRRRKSDSAQTDRAGNLNLAQAAKRSGVSRYVLNSILQCDDAPGVSHFVDKAETEAATATQPDGPGPTRRTLPSRSSRPSSPIRASSDRRWTSGGRRAL